MNKINRIPNNFIQFEITVWRQMLLVFSFIICANFSRAQTPKTYTSSEILLQLKKLKVLGSVLYIAAHPDDENTRLLTYLANEKLYRTGYLSLTRGDGGQNLIGDEQGVELGLIRTQELLAARRIDGAEQFFSRAYDFGFCKSTEEALATWGHDKILADVVWVIRKFKPDVIITRFPADSRAGHGHHSASAVLAREAFDAAADPAKFSEQLKLGVEVWQAKRLLWNTFNFGSTNTQSEDQFKIDVGSYNPLLGKSYGEIAALSRSQHKSQGFGVPAQRGSLLEYFSTISGSKPLKDIMDDVLTGWDRIGQPTIDHLIDAIIHSYSSAIPQKIIPLLVKLYQQVQNSKDEYWKNQKLQDIKNIIEACSGLFLEASTDVPYGVQGDSVKILLSAINRLGVTIGGCKVKFLGNSYTLGELPENKNVSQNITAFIPSTEKISQPYWLENEMTKGSFNVYNQQLIGKAENDPVSVEFIMNIEGQPFSFIIPVRYKRTDPVKGELYQPLSILPKVELNYTEDIYLSINNKPLNIGTYFKYNLKDNQQYTVNRIVNSNSNDKGSVLYNTKAGSENYKSFVFSIDSKEKNSKEVIKLLAVNKNDSFDSYQKIIQYDHIPTITYFHKAVAKVSSVDLKIAGSYVGYIPGAGDKIPDALLQMGYKVTILKENDLTTGNLKLFDAIITGVRAYNTNEWLSDKYDVLMQYVKDGGVLFAQYNTNNSIGPVKAKISPYPLTIGRGRITDENAKVNFLLPEHRVLNYPNVITEKDFEGWVQERSIYNAENIDSNYQCILSMKDPGEEEQKGSLIVADYGKGKFIYSGLVFFRELPAAVPGAYRLFANLIANDRNK